MNQPLLSVSRHEEKYLLNPTEAVALRGMLDALLRRDRYSAGGAYFIRSLYFDTPENTDYEDKVLGVSERSKLRMRLYDPAGGQARLERKAKSGIYGHKTGLWLTRAEAEALIAGDDTPLCRQDTPAARRLWAAFRREWRRPAVLIDYERTAWALDFERVRLTIDEHVRAAKSSALFDPAVPMLGLHSGAMTILEVKYDRFLPGHLRAALSSFCAQPMSISKYAIAREMLY